MVDERVMNRQDCRRSQKFNSGLGRINYLLGHKWNTR